MLIRRKLIEKKARELLQRFQKEPPVDIKALAEDLGVSVVVDPDATSDISGFFVLDEGLPIIGVNGTQPELRQRFTVAHELGHYLLHPHDNGVARVDKSLQVRFRNSESSTGQNIEEMEANLFAAELLMPSADLEKDIQQYGSFDIEGGDEGDNKVALLADKYQVSKQALLIRLGYLGYIQQ